MMLWLKQSTSTTRRIGPFVDSTDGDTEKTGLSIAQADIRLSKAGGAFAQSNDSGGASHDEKGWYYITLNATDTDTLGSLEVNVHVSGALPVWKEFMVLPANVYDSLVGTDKLQVHADEMTAGLITATVVATGAIDADAIAGDAITDAKIASSALGVDVVTDALANRLADHVLNRNMATARASSYGDGTGRFVLQALSLLRNYHFDDSGTLRVYEENDTTEDWNAALGTDSGADPVISVNPS
jgi:hypothetical protein